MKRSGFFCAKKTVSVQRSIFVFLPSAADANCLDHAFIIPNRGMPVKRSRDKLYAFLHASYALCEGDVQHHHQAESRHDARRRDRLVPRKALRDEGTSYHYAPPSRFIEIDERARNAIAQTILEHGMHYLEVITWSTDGFYRETKEKVAYRKSEGCATVEMECSALAACAKLRGAVWGMVLYTADTLADAEHYDERSWGANAYELALTLCLDAVRKIKRCEE